MKPDEAKAILWAIGAVAGVGLLLCVLGALVAIFHGDKDVAGTLVMVGVCVLAWLFTQDWGPSRDSGDDDDDDNDDNNGPPAEDEVEDEGEQPVGGRMAQYMGKN